MGIFDKLFKSNSQNNIPKLQADTWAGLYVILSFTEAANEPPKPEDVEEVLNSLFENEFDLRNMDFKQIIQISNQIFGKTNNSTEKWNAEWEALYTQLGDFKNSETYRVANNLARIAFKLKMLEGMENIAENFVYRLSNSEKFFLMPKQDFMYVLKDAAEDTGYNDFAENN
jgi:hypothetical protein